MNLMPIYDPVIHIFLSHSVIIFANTRLYNEKNIHIAIPSKQFFIKCRNLKPYSCLCMKVFSNYNFFFNKKLKLKSLLLVV